MAQFTDKVYQPDENTLIVDNGGVLDVKTGGVIKANGTQPATIADISEVEAVFSAAERAKFNLILAALKGAGIIAAS